MSQPSLSFPPLTHLGDLSIDEFFRDYWQQKPLFIPKAFTNFQNLISADSLAGLSLEDDVHSRIIIQDQPNLNHFRVQHGPFEDDTFTELPESHWTLLVQHCDSLHPDIKNFLNAFRFVPNWRLDDLMISYATNGGGVGPHFDYYDVFLFQAEGKRRWRVGQQCSSKSPLVPNQPMNILKDFQTADEYIVEPGDLLYIPAKVAHWGEAIGECVTYSIGFRAPSDSDFILDYSQEIASHQDEDQRYRDENLQQQKQLGEISSTSIDYFQNTLQDLSKNREGIAHWLAEFSTRLSIDIEGMYESIDTEYLKSNAKCKLSPFNRAAYFKQGENSIVYINGNDWKCSNSFANILSNYESFQFDRLSSSDQNVALQLAELNLLESI